MPFQLDITENGQNGLPDTGTPHPESYWEITNFEVAHQQGKTNIAETHVHIGGWHDVAAHDAEHAPFFTKHYSIPFGAINFSQTIGDGYDGLYGYALMVPEAETGLSFFDGAITV